MKNIMYILIIALGVGMFFLIKDILFKIRESKNQTFILGDKSDQTNSKSGQKNKITEQEDLQNLKNDFNNQINLLKKDIIELKSKVNKLETVINQPKPTPSNISTNNPSKPTNDVQQKFKEMVKYAEKVDSTGINNGDLKDVNSEYAYLIITIKEPTKATFKVNDLPKAQPSLLSSYQYSLINFVNTSVKSSTPSRIVTTKDGTLTLRDNQWILTSKANIDIV